MPQTLDELVASLPECMGADQHPLKRRLNGLLRRQRQGKPIDRGLAEVGKAIDSSQQRRVARARCLPVVEYPPQLPVSERHADIARAIEEHQVVVVAGETGSGKTTQLPKICLELGRGVAGYIGHTQPRRIAARSVAARIAEELKSKIGGLVGYKVRFSDHTHPDSFIKLMTDGILLAEIQSDPELRAYDTIIIDEAHERSLNIDFLLGYLKQLLPRRPDLKLIITSATINTEAFARFFDNAPVIEVSGRTFPVEMRYRPVGGGDEDDRDRDLPQAIIDAVDELEGEDPLGDILVFLPGEREIREVAEALGKHKMRETEVLPLFSRLSVAEQDRVFRSHRGRRIVLATNVAETSLTVPGIRFVIDSGLVRISRYSHRTKVQRLPIEPVSQASARQRAGRCGRVGPGTCIRLYSEEDFNQRPGQTAPEVQRTNLASVILQMDGLGLGEVEAFPFMDPPDRRYITDGYRLLQELQAVDARRRLTPLGRKLLRLPIDPRLGRMLIAADKEGALEEVLVIASALSVQEPRLRPMDAQQKADNSHREFQDPESDFITLLNLWNWYHEQARHLSNSKLRKLCVERFVSYVRMREWHDIHGQLLSISREMKLTPNAQPAGADSVHRALLAGLLSHVGLKEEEKQYLGARNLKFHLFPGSGVYKKAPKWVMAAELVETTRLYGRTVAAIDPRWLEPLAGHLVKRSWSEPHWEKKPAQVAALERVTLYGLPIVTQRRVNYGPIDPVLAREIFIREALVAGEFRCDAPFWRHNRRLIAELEQLEAKARRRDILVDEETLYAFYEACIPAGIYSGKGFEKWRKEAERETPRLLFMRREDLLQDESTGDSTAGLPDQLQPGGMPLALRYHFEPGSGDDGVTALIPLTVLGQLDERYFEWLVPGLLQEKVIALIKSLPKSLRRNFVPAINFAEAVMGRLEPYAGALTEQLAHELLRITGVEVPLDAWRPETLPAHLTMNFRILDERGKKLAEGRDLNALQQSLSGEVRESLSEQGGQGESRHAIEREGITTWDFAELPEVVEMRRAGLTLKAWPALVDEGESVAIRLFESEQSAAAEMGAGLRRLFALQLREKVKYLRKNMPHKQNLCLRFTAVGRCEALIDDIIMAAIERVCVAPGQVHDAAAFEARLAQGRSALISEAEGIAGAVDQALAEHHQLRRALKGSVPPQRLQLAAQVSEQLERLIYPGFVLATPGEWLGRLPFYLKALQARWDKYDRDPQRDRQQQLELQKLQDDYLKRTTQLAARGQRDEELERFRWLLEELAISLWAQELKTIQPVSIPRLQKLWQGLRG